MPPQIRIASSCSADWSKMQGDGRMRFCNACQLNVYNLSAMTPAEVEQLFLNANGRRLCGRFYARPDGTMLTQDCPVGFRARVARVSRWAGAALTAMMGVGLAAAQNSTNNPTNLVQTQRNETGVSIRVMDAGGAVIHGATITLTDSLTRPVFAGATNAEGFYQVALTPGSYKLRVQQPGFGTSTYAVELRPRQAATLDITLEVAATMGVIVSEFSGLVTIPLSADNSAIPDSSQTPPSENLAPNPPAPSKSGLSRLLHKLGF